MYSYFNYIQLKFQRNFQLLFFSVLFFCYCFFTTVTC